LRAGHLPRVGTQRSESLRAAFTSPRARSTPSGSTA